MYRIRPLPLALVGMFTQAGCFDYGYHNKKEVPDGADPSGEHNVDWGLTDDGACVPRSPLSKTSAVDESCIAEVSTGMLDAQLEWSISHWDAYSGFGDALTVPVVGQLTDDDGDGAITALDMPDIVVVTDDNGASALTRGAMRIVSGDGSEQRTITIGAFGEMQVFPYRYGQVALGDVDSDGAPDIVGLVEVVNGPSGGGGGGSDSNPSNSGTGDTAVVFDDPPVFAEDPVCFAGAWAPDGAVLWVSATPLDCAGHAVALADLEGDGAVEVILGAHVLDGATGEQLWEGAAGGEGRYPAYKQVGDISFALDLDGNGLQEVIAGSTVYTYDGRVRCTVGADFDDGFPAAADFDGDGVGEFVLVGNGAAHVHDVDCRLQAFWPLQGAGNGGPPTIADFDGDGTPEIGVAEATTYTVYEGDGSVVWSMPTTDASSYATGSSVFDFDADGRAEVVYGDEMTLWVFDGATGAVRLQDDRHSSRTLHEYPVVADVDGDGQAEIVVSQGGGHHDDAEAGLYVLGSASGAWFGDRQVWNQHAFSITNINDDLSVPAPGLANWPTYNTFRSGDLAPVSSGRTSDAIAYAQVCAEECVGTNLQVAVRLGNGGMSAMRSGVPISAYAEVGGARVWLQTLRTSTVLESGTNSRTLTFTFPADAVPEGIVWIVADDDNGVQQLVECHEDNNEVRLEGLSCDEASP
jgi:hypothetical protein